MESYELTKEQVIDWAINYASYEELEETAKAMYSHHKQRQKTERPYEYVNAKKIKNQIKKEKEKERKARRKAEHQAKKAQQALI